MEVGACLFILKERRLYTHDALARTIMRTLFSNKEKISPIPPIKTSTAKREQDHKTTILDMMIAAYYLALVPRATFAAASPRALVASGVVSRLLSTKVRSLPAALLVTHVDIDLLFLFSAMTAVFLTTGRQILRPRRCVSFCLCDSQTGAKARGDDHQDPRRAQGQLQAVSLRLRGTGEDATGGGGACGKQSERQRVSPSRVRVGYISPSNSVFHHLFVKFAVALSDEYMKIAWCSVRQIHGRRVFRHNLYFSFYLA